MERKIVMFSMLVKEGVWARLYINDLPFFTEEEGSVSRSGPVNEFLVPGENELVIELLRVPKQLYTPFLDEAVTFKFYEVLDTTTSPLITRTLHEVIYPEFFTRAPEERRRLPFLHRSFFDPGFDLHSPAWLAAQPAPFACDGTPELRDAVRRVHAALEAGDADRFFGEIALKLDHYERAYEGHDGASAATKRNAFREDIFSHPLVMRPLDPDELHFEPRAGGRVAYVTRPAGGSVLEADCPDVPGLSIKTDLLFTQYGGDWRAFI